MMVTRLESIRPKTLQGLLLKPGLINDVHKRKEHKHLGRNEASDKHAKLCQVKSTLHRNKCHGNPYDIYQN